MILTIKENYDEFVGYNYYDLQLQDGLINIAGVPSVCSQYERNNKRWHFSGNTKEDLLKLVSSKLNNCTSKRLLIKEILENEN